MLTTHCTNLVELNRIYALVIRTQILELGSEAFHWNNVIRGYSRLEAPVKALFVYITMSRAGVVPDCYSIPLALKCAIQAFDVLLGKEFHGVSVKLNLECNEFCESGLISLYCKVGEFENARKVFDQNCERKLGSWNAIIGACGSLGDLDLAFQLHKCVYQARMLERSDMLMLNSLVDMYGKCGRMDLAFMVFAKMDERNVSSWTSMIVGYAMHGHVENALEYFKQMRGSGIRPNHVTFVGVLSACVHGGLVQEGKQYFHMMKTVYNIVPHMNHYGCMVDMLGRAGLFDEAREILNNMPMKPNLVLWGCLMGACEKYGNVELAELASKHLRELEPCNNGCLVVLSNIYASKGIWHKVEKFCNKLSAKTLTSSLSWFPSTNIRKQADDQAPVPPTTISINISANMEWFKKAEDIFETMDRQAKKVVNELVDEQDDSQSQAPAGKKMQAKRTKSKARAQKRPPIKETPETSETPPERPGTIPQSDSAINTDSIENHTEADDDNRLTSSSVGKQSKTQVSLDVEAGNAITPSGIRVNMVDTSEPDTVDVGATEAVGIPDHSHVSGDVKEGKSSSDQNKDTIPEIQALDAAEEKNDHSVVGKSTSLGDADVSSDIAQEKSLSLTSHSNGDLSEKQKDEETKIELTSVPKKEGQKNDSSKKMVEEQLNEAQGLLKSTNSSGQSKEARLARVCAGLSSRLQEYKSENVQLEELLMAERELSKSSEYRIKQLQQELASCKLEATRVESNMAEALAAKNSEIKSLVSSLDELKKYNAISEGNLASLQANMESLMRNRELAETRMAQALREELASAERRAEEERVAHNATKMAAMEREVELERRAVDASTALARIQRVADERTAKGTDLEQKIALLEVECATLNQELQEMEARSRRSQRKAPEEANQMIQIQAMQEVERARQGQRDAENKLSSLEAEVQKMRVEMAAMKRDAEHYSRQEHMELEKRYRELTDLLYYKQTQLETMASEKAAAEFQLEKEIKRLQESQAEAERSRVSRRASSSWEDESDLKTLEPLPLHHRHMAAASIQLQKAAKLLDTGAVRATRFLWRYPTARVSLLCYLVFVHLFLMYLLHRLQAQADRFSSREVAESMGLSNPALP
ncbi:unnamed protein product [Rhodiola kirilowii]